MGRKSRTHQLTASILGQHFALSVAAGLARTQLVPEPLKVYDAQHLGEMLDAVGRALAKVAPLYVQDSQGGAPRELSQEELEGAEVRRSATLLVLKDGRKLSGVTMKRGDLRQAVAILKAVGIPELTARPAPPAPPPQETPAWLARMTQIEQLLRPPLVADQVAQANRLAVALARGAPDGQIANLAMQLVSAVHDARAEEPQDAAWLRLALARLRAALEEQEKSNS
jgi:hypothetical protein